MSWAAKLSDPYRIEQGKGFQVKNFDPGDTGERPSKAHAREPLDKDKGIDTLGELQLSYPKMNAQQRKELARARKELAKS